MATLKVTAEPGSHALMMSREFNAPKALVFKAFTDPTLVPRWWGPQNTTTTVDQMDVKKGGIWRYVQHDADGGEYAFHGVYHEIVPNERVVYTFEFEGMPGHVVLETVAFEEYDGKTTLLDSLVFQTREARDGMVQSGMEEGSAQTWDRLEEVLKTL